ncbi:MAG: nitrite reductase large subunit NirB [Candidatus Sumerlaeaceae bacterium]
MREKLVFIGNGMAGIACLENILRLAPERYEVTVFGAEKYPNYNRIQLSPVLAGDMNWDDIILNPQAWYAEHNIRLHMGVKATAIDRHRRVVYGDDGIEEPYDKLVLATGSNALIIPIPGHDKQGVVVFRTIDDCKAMIEASKEFSRAAVIGGGLLGLEAARGLKNLGMEVSVVHLADWLMERQLDPGAGQYLARAIREQGIDVLLGRQTEAIEGEHRVTGLRFKDGQRLDTDFVVMAAGIKPNAELARAAALECNRGVVVSDFMQTSDPTVYAVGECAEHRGICYGLVAPLYEQGRVLAAHLTGGETVPYTGSVLSTKLKVSGVDVFAGGIAQEDAECEVMRIEDSASGIYKKAVIKEGRLVGAVLVGDMAPAMQLEQLLRSGKELNGERPTLLIGKPKEANTGPPKPTAELVDLPGDAIICGCNGVCKGTIVAAIHSQNLTTRKEVAAVTNASRSCGGCGPQVDALIAMVHGDTSVPHRRKKPLCDCTLLSRDDVVAAIREHRLTSVNQAMSFLHWTTEGCGVCRPAINYFLTMCWPGENEDDPRSRFVNERVHANIQKDGTYSVVPRMYGGVTTPAELERIAQVARKHDVPLVKITGGQRIDLLGITKESLPAIWEELDMPSGFAYGKAVRTVKTCVGSTFCRFGTRDSIEMGIRIEKTFENLWTPAKVKMAVNGCPRNCAESLIKDVGLIAVDTAWQIYVGGNGGVKVRTAELLATVETDDEAIEIIAAFLQLYRREAQYNERTSSWCENVGIDYIHRNVVENLEQRLELAEQMWKALNHRVDPWRDRVEKIRRGDEATEREFSSLQVGRVLSIPGEKAESCR